MASVIRDDDTLRKDARNCTFRYLLISTQPYKRYGVTYMYRNAESVWSFFKVPIFFRNKALILSWSEQVVFLDELQDIVNAWRAANPNIVTPLLIR